MKGRSSMAEQVELNKKRVEMLEKFKEASPDFMAAEYALIQKTYQDGALSVRMKRLMSLAVALRAGCTNCILAQAQYALDEGASREEILETLYVVISMSGTTGVGECLRVIEFLDETGKL
jgi:AhpD family alkylhydroperoxidase